jgi:hypothetical protein
VTQAHQEPPAPGPAGPTQRARALPNAATLMVACYLGLIIAAAGLAIAVWPAWLGSIMLACFALALITFLPGRQPLPRGTRSLERIHNPELDRAVNIACEATGARPPDFVAMTIVPGVFPIRMGFGIWPRVGVAIGFPVWDAAPPEVKAALLVQAVLQSESSSTVKHRSSVVVGHIFGAAGIGNLEGVVSRDTRNSLASASEKTDDSGMGIAAGVSSVIITLLGWIFGICLRPVAKWIARAEHGSLAAETERTDTILANLAGYQIFAESLRLQVLAPNRYYWATRAFDRYTHESLNAIPLDEIHESMLHPEEGLYERLLDQEDGDSQMSGTDPWPRTRARLKAQNAETRPSGRLEEMVSLLTTASDNMTAVRDGMNRG